MLYLNWSVALTLPLLSSCWSRANLSLLFQDSCCTSTGLWPWSFLSFHPYWSRGPLPFLFSGLWLYLNWSLALLLPRLSFYWSRATLLTSFRPLAEPQLVFGPDLPSPCIPIDLVSLSLYYFQDSGCTSTGMWTLLLPLLSFYWSRATLSLLFQDSGCTSTGLWPWSFLSFHPFWSSVTLPLLFSGLWLYLNWSMGAPSSPFIPFDLVPISLYYFSGLWLYLNWSSALIFPLLSSYWSRATLSLHFSGLLMYLNLSVALLLPLLSSLLISCHFPLHFSGLWLYLNWSLDPAPPSPFILIDLVPCTISLLFSGLWLYLNWSLALLLPLLPFSALLPSVILASYGQVTNYFARFYYWYKCPFHFVKYLCSFYISDFLLLIYSRKLSMFLL